MKELWLKDVPPFQYQHGHILLLQLILLITQNKFYMVSLVVQWKYLKEKNNLHIKPITEFYIKWLEIQEIKEMLGNLRKSWKWKTHRKPIVSLGKTLHSAPGTRKWWNLVEFPGNHPRNNDSDCVFEAFSAGAPEWWYFTILLIISRIFTFWWNFKKFRLFHQNEKKLFFGPS